MHGIFSDKFLKTRKIREAEEAARRSEMTKVMSDTLSSLLFHHCCYYYDYCYSWSSD